MEIFLRYPRQCSDLASVREISLQWNKVYRRPADVTALASSMFTSSLDKRQNKNIIVMFSVFCSNPIYNKQVILIFLTNKALPPRDCAGLQVHTIPQLSPHIIFTQLFENHLSEPSIGFHLTPKMLIDLVIVVAKVEPKLFTMQVGHWGREWFLEFLEENGSNTCWQSHLSSLGRPNISHTTQDSDSCSNKPYMIFVNSCWWQLCQSNCLCWGVVDISFTP